MRFAVRVTIIVLVSLASAIPGWGAAPGRDKSLRKALLLSMVVPGAGEAYLGYTGRAKAMFVSEAGVWTGLALFRVQGRMREDSYKEMAHLFAGAPSGADDYYYKAIAYYLSSEEYNVDVLRDARLRYPDDREAQLAYFEQGSYFGDRAWEWDSLEKMEAYDRARTLSRESYRRATLTTGFAVLNRMISMIDVYLSFKLGREAVGQSGLGLRVEAAPDYGFRLYLGAPF